MKLVEAMRTLKELRVVMVAHGILRVLGFAAWDFFRVTWWEFGLNGGRFCERHTAAVCAKATGTHG